MQLFMGIQVAQSTSPVNPAWTIASNQWEAATIAFKTTNSLGLFKLVQSTAAAGTTSATLNSISTLPGSLVVIAIRTTNGSAGAPVITVSANSAADSYTVTTPIVNSSDGTHGSSLTYAYVASSNGSAANTITISATNTPTAMIVDYLEYANATGGIDGSALTASGSSTSPAAGSFTPGVAGDLIITAYATAANAGPTAISGSFFIRCAVYNSSGSLAVADNFGNGALTGGIINVNAIGTEE
jgi:hypothetical protein